MARAVELMRLAAVRLRNDMESYETQRYDDADCDGYCLADDLESEADELELKLKRGGLSTT